MSIGQPVLFEYGTGCEWHPSNSASCNRRRMRVWRHKNTAYTPRNIQPTVPYGGGSVMVWGCISHDCKLDLITIQGNLTGDQYIRDVLQPVVVPNFDNHTLATMPVYMDDNAQASSFNSCNRLPPKRNRDLRSLASHEPGFPVVIASAIPDAILLPTDRKLPSQYLMT
jgi:hypothetical protein